MRAASVSAAPAAGTSVPDTVANQVLVADLGGTRLRVAVLEAINENVPAPTITMSLFARFASRQDDSFAMKMIAALRNEFGGHAVRTQ